MTHYYDKMRNLMTREASKSDQQMAQPRYGKVTGYDPKLNLVQCALIPEKMDDGSDILTGWMQIVTPMVGPGWGIVSPLKPDDHVIMLPVYNSGSEYVVLGATFNDVDVLAKGPNDIGGGDELTEVGEFLLRSESGTTMKFVNSDTLMIKADYHKEEVLHIVTRGTDVDITVDNFINVTCNTAQVDARSSVTINAPNTIVNGHLQVNGSINASQEITDHGQSMSGMRAIYNVHIHDDSPPPIPRMSS